MVLASAVAAALYAHNAAAQPTRIMECRAEGLPEGQITAPGSYVLARNLSARGDCLVIEADFVTIDLAGFAITGNGTGTGIRADRVAIEVRNGTITGFMTGVRVRGSAIIEGMRVIGNTGVGIDTSLQRSIVTGNVVRNNGDDGMFPSKIAVME
jgi:hypothetical protein